MLNEHLNNLYYTPLAAQWPLATLHERGGQVINCNDGRLTSTLAAAAVHWWPGPAAGNPVIVDILISVVPVITRTTVPLHSVAE